MSDEEWTPPTDTLEPDPGLLAAITERLAGVRERDRVAKSVLGERWDDCADDGMRDRDLLLELVEAFEKNMADTWKVAGTYRQAAEQWRGTGDLREGWCAAQAYAYASAAEHCAETFAEGLDLWWRIVWQQITDVLTMEGLA